MAGHGWARLGKARQGKGILEVVDLVLFAAWRGAAWRGKARRGSARQGKEILEVVD